MRFDTPVFLQTITPGEYNERTGDYAADSVAETEMYANVTDSSAQAQTLVYGGIKQGSVTVRFQDVVPVFDYIRIGSKRYRADNTRALRTKTTFIMSEVQ